MCIKCEEEELALQKGQASPTSDNRGTPNKVLAYMTRATILQILARFRKEVNEARDISCFLDRIMEDLDRPGQDKRIDFDPQAPEGGRFT
jgi:hypothetical protein